MRPVQALAVAWALAGCEEDQLFVSAFEAEAPVVEVVCPGAEAMSPWQDVALPPGDGLSAVWGTDASTLWVAGGDGAVLRFDGAAWQPEAEDLTAVDLLALHGSARDDLWAVGRGGVALHFDGTAWRVVPSGTTEPLTGVWAFARDDAWMIGAEGVRHWDGRAIRAEPGGPVTPMNDLWASSPVDLWIAGDQEIHHFDGARFTTEPIHDARIVSAIWGTDGAHIYSIGHGTSGQPGFAEQAQGHWLFGAAPPRAVFFALWGVAPRELWVGASDTSIFVRRDGAWCRELLGAVGAINGFFGAGGRLWAVGARRGAGGTTESMLLERKGS